MSTITLPKEVESHVKIRFQDCDPFNHLNNAKYLDYFINAREDQLIHFYDFNVHEIAKKVGLTWVVAQNQIAYIAPVEVMELVTIQTRLIAYSNRTILLEGVMWDKSKTQLKAVMWSKQAHYNLRAGNSEQHSTELMLLFDEIHYPIDSTQGFEERVKAIKNYSQSK